jgi:hypothetical protein
MIFWRMMGKSIEKIGDGNLQTILRARAQELSRYRHTAANGSNRDKFPASGAGCCFRSDCAEFFRFRQEFWGSPARIILTEKKPWDGSVWLTRRITPLSRTSDRLSQWVYGWAGNVAEIKVMATST